MFYDYDCPNCGKIEIRHGINETIEECPKCKSKEIKRLITGGQGFLLKGRGWAKDGYSKEN